MTATAPLPAPMTSAEIRVTRERLGLSGEQLADALEVTPRAVRRWESGQRPIPGPHAAAVARMAQTTDELVTAVVAELRDDGPDADGIWWVSVYATTEGYLREHPEATLPASWHRAAMGAVRDRLPGVRLTYLDDPSDDDGELRVRRPQWKTTS